MVSEKTGLLDVVEEARQKIADVTLEDIDRLEPLLIQMREAVDALLVKGNPHGLSAEEVDALRTVYAGAAGDIQSLSDHLAVQMEKLRHSATAAAAYLKNS